MATYFTSIFIIPAQKAFCELILRKFNAQFLTGNKTSRYSVVNSLKYKDFLPSQLLQMFNSIMSITPP